MKKLLYRMFFTVDDELDLAILHSFLMTLVVVAGAVFEIITTGKLSVYMIFACIYLASLYTIGSIPINRARLVSESPLLGKLADKVAKIPFEPHEWASGDKTAGKA